MQVTGSKSILDIRKDVIFNRISEREGWSLQFWVFQLIETLKRQKWRINQKRPLFFTLKAKSKAAEMENQPERKMDDQAAPAENKKKSAAAAVIKKAVSFGYGFAELISKIRNEPDSAKEVFLWELLSNASHALYKLRAESLVKATLHPELGDLFVLIVPDYKKGTLTIMDNGIGMDEKDLEEFMCDVSEYVLNRKLGNIPEYATVSPANLSALVTTGKDDVRLGFHSAYMVADKVMVTTKKTQGSQFVWTGQLKSDGCLHSCTIVEDTSGKEVLGKTGLDRMRGGTAVTLFLKGEHIKYADKSHLIELTKEYVEHLMYQVYISVKNDDDQKIFYDAPKERIPNDAPKERILNDEPKLKFEKLRAVFEKIIGSRVDEVVVDDCVPELATHLSCDRKRFVISPMSPVAEDMRQKLEAGEEIEDLVELHFQSSTRNILAYDLLHRTKYFYDRDLDKALRRPRDYVARNQKDRQGLIDACLAKEKAGMSMV